MAFHVVHRILQKVWQLCKTRSSECIVDGRDHALFIFIFSSVVFYTSTHCVETLHVAGKDWEFLTRFSEPPSLPKQLLRCGFFFLFFFFFMLAATRVVALQQAHLYQTPTVLCPCHSF